MSCSWSALLLGLTAYVSLKSTISTPLLCRINETLIRRSLYLNGRPLTRRCGGAGVLIFKLAPLSGLLSPVTNTLARVKLRLEVEAGHPLIISWLLVLPKARLPPPLVTFWPFHRSEMSINPKDGWPGSCIVCLISDIPCRWVSFPPPPLFCAEAKKSNITHRKSNYFAFRPDKRFKGKESPSATSLCLHLRCIRAVTQLKLGSA